MKEFVLSFIVLGFVLAGFGHYVRPHLVETKVVTKIVEKEKVVMRVVKAPLSSETKAALDEYYLRHYGMYYYPK